MNLRDDILSVLIEYDSATSDDLLRELPDSFEDIIAKLDEMVLDGEIDAVVDGTTTWYRA